MNITKESFNDICFGEFKKTYRMIHRKKRRQPKGYESPVERCLHDPKEKEDVKYLASIKRKNTIWTFSETEEDSEEYYFVSGFDTNPEANIIGHFVTDKPYTKPTKVEIDNTVCYFCKKNICMGPRNPTFIWRDFFVVNNEWVMVEGPTYSDGAHWSTDNVMDIALTLYPKDFDSDDIDSYHWGGYESNDADCSHIKNPKDHDLTYWGGRCMYCDAPN